MKDIKPRFFDTNNRILAHLEWEAIRMIAFDGSHMDIANAYPIFEQRQFQWIEPFNDRASDEHHAIKQKIREKEYPSLEDFYRALQPLLKPKKRGKALRDAKYRTTRARYQRKRLGDAFIEGRPKLFKDARDAAKYIADKNKDREVFNDLLSQLIFRHKALDLTDEQIQTLWNFLDAQVDKHLKLDRIEAAILDEDNKNLYFMWGKIKREYPKGDTFAWPAKQAAAICKCSKTNVAPIMKKLENLGAITLIQAGKSGENSGRAALYRREA